MIRRMRMAEPTNSIADEQFPGTHAEGCTCPRCINQRRQLERDKRARAKAIKAEVRRKRATIAFSALGGRAAAAWNIVIGIATAAMSAYTMLAAVAIVGVMARALWQALETGGDQWIVALCCVPGLLVVIWLNQQLGAE